MYTNSNTITPQIPYKMIDFVKRCISKFLNKKITGCTKMDLWKFKSQKEEVWNEFMVNFTKLIVDSNAKFNHEYTYEFEVGKSKLFFCVNIIYYFYDKSIVERLTEDGGVLKSEQVSPPQCTALM